MNRRMLVAMLSGLPLLLPLAAAAQTTTPPPSDERPSGRDCERKPPPQTS